MKKGLRLQIHGFIAVIDTISTADLMKKGLRPQASSMSERVYAFQPQT